MSSFDNPVKFKRRFPRRQFKNPVGVLARGGYEVLNGLELGEGGMLFEMAEKFAIGTHVVMNFFVPERDFITVRGEIVYSQALKKPLTGRKAFGVKFNNLSFESKRMIRDFIAEKTTPDA